MQRNKLSQKTEQMSFEIMTNLVEQDEPITSRSPGRSLREVLERGVR